MERGEKKISRENWRTSRRSEGKKLGARNATRAETLDGIQTVLEMVFFCVSKRNSGCYRSLRFVFWDPFPSGGSLVERKKAEADKIL